MFNILACIAEFQLDMIKENTIAGLEAARDAGKTLGRPLKLSSQQIYQIYDDVCEGATLTDLAKEYGVSLSTLKRGLARLEEVEEIADFEATDGSIGWANKKALTQITHGRSASIPDTTMNSSISTN